MAILNEDLRPSGAQADLVTPEQSQRRRASLLSEAELAELDQHDALQVEHVSKRFVKSRGVS